MKENSITESKILGMLSKTITTLGESMKNLPNALSENQEMMNCS